MFVDGARVAQAPLPAGRETLAVAVRGCELLRGCRASRVTVQSAPWTDAPSGETRGVFVGRVAIDRGGVAGASAATWACALALALGLVAAAFSAAPTASAAAALALWSAAALWIFRLPLSPWWPWLALAAAAVGSFFHVFRRVEQTIGSSIRRSIGSGWGTAGFAGWAGALVGLLFLEAFTRGWVLGQPQMLEGYYPWRAALPSAWDPRPGPPFGDVPMLVYPFLAFVRERLLDGQLPLWTASLNGGQPFLAAYQAAVFSPLTWTALLVPLPHATVVIALLRLLVGGVGLFVFVRGLGLSRGAAFVAGTAYLLNPFSVIWLEHPPGGVPPWLPWMLHTATRAAEGRRFGPAGLALATALVLLGGHPHTGLFCTAFGAAWAIAAAASTADRGLRVRRMAAVVAALTLGAAVAAIQILPFVEYLFLSRGYTWRQFAGLNPLAAPASTLITALVPRFLGEHYADTYAGPLNYLEQTMYAGIPVLILAVVGSAAGAAAPRRDWRPIFFTATGVLATLAVYGAPGVLEVISALPLVKGATLTRIPIVAITSAIVAAAFSVEALAARRRTPAPPRDDRRHRRRARHCRGGPGRAHPAALVPAPLDAERRHVALEPVGAAPRRRDRARARGVRAASPRTRSRGRGAHRPRRPRSVRGGHRLPPPAAGRARLPGRRRADAPARRAGSVPRRRRQGRADAEQRAGLRPAGRARLRRARRRLVRRSARCGAGVGPGAPAARAARSRLARARSARCPVSAGAARFAVDPAHWERIPTRPRRSIAIAASSPARRSSMATCSPPATPAAACATARSTCAATTILDADPGVADRPERAATADAVGTARIAAYEHEHVTIDTDAPGRRLLVLSDTWYPAGARPSTAHPPRSRAPTSLSAPSPCRPAGIAWSSTTRRRRSGSVRRSPAWRCCSSRAGRRSPSAADGPCAPSAALRSRAARAGCGPTFPAHHDQSGPVSWRNAASTRSRTGGCDESSCARRGGRSSTRLVWARRRIDVTKASAPPVTRTA